MPHRIYFAHAKDREYFLPIKWSKILFNIGSVSRVPPYSLGWILNSQNSIHFTICKHEYIKVLFGLMQATAHFQGLMTGILKDLSFTITYLDDIIIFSRTAEEHLKHIKQFFKKLWNAHLSMKLSKCHFFTKEIQYLKHIHRYQRYQTTTIKTQAINNMQTTKNS